MLVSIFSDASLCHQTKASSWGGWAKSARGVARGGGVLKFENCLNTNTLEAAAAVNALKLSILRGITVPGDSVLLQTDNTGVPAILRGKHSGQGQQIAAVFKELCATHKLSYTWRHVKGHKGHKAPRFSVNTYCDKVAGFYLSIERHQRKPSHYPPPTKIPYGLTVPDALLAKFPGLTYAD